MKKIVVLLLWCAPFLFARQTAKQDTVTRAEFDSAIAVKLLQTEIALFEIEMLADEVYGKRLAVYSQMDSCLQYGPCSKDYVEFLFNRHFALRDKYLRFLLREESYISMHIGLLKIEYTSSRDVLNLLIAFDPKNDSVDYLKREIEKIRVDSLK